MKLKNVKKNYKFKKFRIKKIKQSVLKMNKNYSRTTLNFSLKYKVFKTKFRIKSKRIKIFQLNKKSFL